MYFHCHKETGSIRAYEKERKSTSNEIPVKTLDLQGGSGGGLLWVFFCLFVLIQGPNSKFCIKHKAL